MFQGQIEVPFQLVCGVVEGVGIVDDAVGGFTFSLQRPLIRLSFLQCLLVPAARIGDAPDAGRIRGLYKDDQIAQIVPAGFQQDGGIQENRLHLAGLPEPLNVLFEDLPDSRMDKLLQIGPGGPALGRRPEDPAGQFGPNHFSVLVKY